MVRAYSDAAVDAINNATITEEMIGVQIEVEIEYSELEKLKYWTEKNGAKIVDSIYENTIKCYLELPKEKIEDLISELKINNYKIAKSVNIRKNV